MRRESKIIVIISVAIASVIIAYLAGYFDSILTRLTDPLWVSVFATVVLIVVNAFYIVQNRQSIKEMEKARKAEFLPFLKFELTFLGPVFILLKVNNVGKGPATDIKVKIVFSPIDEERDLDQDLMMPNDPIRIFLPDGGLKKAYQDSAEVKVNGTYRDIFGKSYEVDEVIDTKKFIDGVKELHRLMEPDVPSLIRKIERHLEKLANEVQRINR